ncbi:CPBP family intramembrane glutamic endopeptidase [Streptococcus dysgalactiae]|uniref:CPBP family intramembrane glutamic endopeptidase n=1 Tax=Streptococcus dysgalactiae TaxID=1334 RepID=UPI001FA9CC0E|nr:type II CAAX endopeptidase family protein [Streptococcus dysgalactiae]
MMKKLYKIPVAFILIMAIAMYITYHIYGVSYGDPRFSHTFLPTYFILVPFSIFTYFKYKQNLGNHKPRYRLFMTMFIPVILLGIFTVINKFELSMVFLIPLIDGIFVGISEELVFRGIVFTNIAKEKGIFKSILISALIFSLLHSINVLGGLSISSMIAQLVSTFLAGIFFAAVYNYTKSITLLVIYHAVWDYILLTDVAQSFSFIGNSFLLLTILEVIIAITLLIRYKSE